LRSEDLLSMNVVIGNLDVILYLVLLVVTGYLSYGAALHTTLTLRLATKSYKSFVKMYT
jgi:hypothetical protein